MFEIGNNVLGILFIMADYKIVPQFSTRGRRESIDRTYMPVESKYKHVWQSARTKLKFRLIINGIIKAATSGDKEEKVLIQHSIKKENLPEPNHEIHEPSHKYLFLPKSPFIVFWNILIGLSMVYTSIFMPFLLVFPQDSSNDYIDPIDKLMASLYAGDFIINLNLAIYSKSGHLITNRKKILLSYLKSWMLFDLIAFFPFETVLEIDSKYPAIFKLARISRLYKLLKISKVFKLMKVSSHYNLIMKLQDIFSLRLLNTQLILIIFTICLCLHIVTCIWVFSSQILNDSPDTWVYRSKLLDADTTAMYISGLYWAFASFSTVGYGDISAGTDSERIISIFWMMFSTIILGFIIGSLSYFFSKLDTFDKTLLNKLSIIDEFSTDTNLSKATRMNLREALRQSASITGYSLADKNDILTELPKSLMYEIAITMHRGAAKYLKFFQNKDDAVISAIVPELCPNFIMKSNFVYKESDYPDEIYFIVKGRVLYLDPKSMRGVYTTKKKDYFGDIELLLKIPRKYPAVARADTEILSLSSRAVNKIRKDYPLVWLELKSIAKERKKVMATNVKRLETLKHFSRMHSESETSRKNFQIFHKNRRDMLDTLKVHVLAKKKGVSVFDITSAFDRIHVKLDKMITNVRGYKAANGYF